MRAFLPESLLRLLAGLLVLFALGPASALGQSQTADTGKPELVLSRLSAPTAHPDTELSIPDPPNNTATLDPTIAAAPQSLISATLRQSLLH